MIQQDGRFDVRVFLPRQIQHFRIETEKAVGIIVRGDAARLVQRFAQFAFAHVSAAVVDRQTRRVAAVLVAGLSQQVLGAETLHVGIAQTRRPVHQRPARDEPFAFHQREIFRMGLGVFLRNDDPAEEMPRDVASAFAHRHHLDLLFDALAHGPAPGVERGTFLDVELRGHLPFGLVRDHQAVLAHADDVEPDLRAEEPAGRIAVAPGVAAHHQADVLLALEGDRIPDDEAVLGQTFEDLGVFPARGVFAGDDENGFGVRLFERHDLHRTAETLGHPFGESFRHVVAPVQFGDRRFILIRQKRHLELFRRRCDQSRRREKQTCRDRMDLHFCSPFVL